MHKNPYSLLANKTVLIVDDSFISNSVVRTLLGRNGVQVIVAQNGDEAFKTFLESKEFSISAILMDIAMPVMNGFEATKKIRALSRSDCGIIPIIALTADENACKQKCIEAGMTDFLAKPFKPDALLHLLSLYVE